MPPRRCKWGGVTRRRSARHDHDQPRRNSCASTTASVRSRSARTPTSSSGTTTRSARMRSSIASTSTEPSTTTAWPTTERLTKVQQEKQALIAAEQGERRKPTPPERSGRSVPTDRRQRRRRQRHSRRSASLAQRRRRTVQASAARRRPPKLAAGVLVITNARIHPVTNADDRARLGPRPRRRHRGGRRQRHRRRPARPSSTPPAPTSIQDGSTRDRRSACPIPGAARIRRRQRDARFQSAAPHRRSPSTTTATRSP